MCENYDRTGACKKKCVASIYFLNNRFSLKELRRNKKIFYGCDSFPLSAIQGFSYILKLFRRSSVLYSEAKQLKRLLPRKHLQDTLFLYSERVVSLIKFLYNHGTEIFLQDIKKKKQQLLNQNTVHIKINSGNDIFFFSLIDKNLIHLSCKNKTIVII